MQKFLSDAGIASRRHAEEYIEQGRVLVNDEIVDRLPAFVDPKRDRVIFNGAVVKLLPPKYFIVHKPKGVICSHRDPAGRPRAVDLLPPLKQKLFPVGRLDEDSTGLLLMTNDGELAQQVTHPRYGIPKLYRAEVKGRVPASAAEQLLGGVRLAEGKVRAAKIEIVKADRERSILNVTLREGRNRQVRRMLAQLGFPVKKLKRLQIGPLSLRGLPVGAARELSRAEVQALQKACREAAERASRRRRRAGGAGGKSKSKQSAAKRPAESPPKGRGRGASKRREDEPQPKRRIVS